MDLKNTTVAYSVDINSIGQAAKDYVNNTARAHVHNALVMMNASCSIRIANATAIRFSDITWCVCFLE